VDLTFQQVYVLIVVAFLIFGLYKEIVNPALTFFMCTVALVLGQIITVNDLLAGLSNPNIILIFLLVLVTAGIRLVFGTNLFSGLFNPRLGPKAFLLRVMATVTALSPFLNNTPIVAFMIPYVKDWANRTGYPASKFLIPLSYATILAGMITVIGTSTNLVLNGLITTYKLEPLAFKDYFYLGVMVTIAGGAYLYFVGYKLLPSNPNEIEELRENLKEYIIETEIAPGSKMVGQTVKEAGLRNLKDVFLVEIVRDEKVISPVTPDEVLEAGDTLFFSGNTQAIFNLVKDDTGLFVPKEDTHDLGEHFNFVEAVIPANSGLIGQKIKDSNFRQRFDSSIIAIHRDGKRVAGRVGETNLEGGDFLLLLSGAKNGENGHSNKSDLFFLSVPKPVKEPVNKKLKYFGVIALIFLILGVIGNIPYVGKIPIFEVSLIILVGFVLTGVLSLNEVRKEMDLSLLMILVCSLAVGVALEKSGTADLIAQGLITSTKSLGAIAVMASLFMVTIFLTALITNAAAVSIVFPIAMSMAEQMHLPYTPFFVAIAYAASGDFMTPIGYQTNLMVYGPGGYTFRDFLKVGTPLTIIYIIISITFIAYFYGLN
jgi:di/tricarboxylate transporter